jgi:zinc protease
MDDLTAASYEDVVEFFKTYYVPGNASLVIAGDIDPAATRTLVERWFGDVPAGAPVLPQAAPVASLTEQKRVVHEDKVQLPRLYLAWLSPPLYAPGDAELDILASVLAGGKNSRLYKRLVYDLQIAQDVNAFQSSSMLSSTFQIVVTARAGHGLSEIERIVWEELARVKAAPPAQREVDRAVNQYEASFYDRLENNGTKADLINAYLTQTGNPDYFNEDLARYKALDPKDIQSVASTVLRRNGVVILSIVPEGKAELAATQEGGQ